MALSSERPRQARTTRIISSLSLFIREKIFSGDKIVLSHEQVLPRVYITEYKVFSGAIKVYERERERERRRERREKREKKENRERRRKKVGSSFFSLCPYLLSYSTSTRNPVVGISDIPQTRAPRDRLR